MMISSSGNLMDSLRQHQLLAPDQLAQLSGQSQGRPGDARLFAKTLIQRGWLSALPEPAPYVNGGPGVSFIERHHLIDYAFD